MKGGTNVGFGRLCVAAHVKSWFLSSGIAVKQPVVSFGNKSLQPTKVVKVTVTSGKLIDSSFLKKHINVLVKEAGRPIIWKVGTTHLDNLVTAL